MDMTPKNVKQKNSKYRIMSKNNNSNKKLNAKKEENYEKEINKLMVSKYIAMSTMNYIEIESEKCLNKVDNKSKCIGAPKRRVRLSSENNLKIRYFSKNNIRYSKDNTAKYDSEVKEAKYNSPSVYKENTNFSCFKRSFIQSLQK